MKVLLDTHSLLWWLRDDPQLQTRARQIIADPTNDILVSVVSLWEIAVKVRLGKLHVEIPAITKSIDRLGFATLDITRTHLAALGALPKHTDHRDPFDHLLIAQAITEDAMFVSEDRNTKLYSVRFVTCSD